MPYVLGAKSRAELKGVHDGLRTAEEQKALVASGASQTMNSMHRPQADGFSHAMDLVLFINGKSRLQQVAEAVLQAAIDIGGAHASY